MKSKTKTKTKIKATPPTLVPPPAPDPVDDEFEKALDQTLKEAAIEGAKAIKAMISDCEISDASRLSAAKWAIERVTEKDKGPGADNSLSSLLEIVRQLRLTQTNPKAPPPPANIAKDIEPSLDFDQWIDGNLDD